jgi:hypothetical protein
MKTKLILLALLAVSVLAGCSKTPGKDTVPTGDDLPGLCTITGADGNTLPETTVTLTAEAEGATSYVWSDAAGVIEGETSNTYVATKSGSYYAAGVNAAGKGQISEGKQVTIIPVGNNDFDPEGLEGTYTGTGIPLGIMPDTPPGDATWTSEMTFTDVDPDLGIYIPYYMLTNFGNTGHAIKINLLDGNRLVVDQDHVSCAISNPEIGQLIRGFFVVPHLRNDAMTGDWLVPCEVMWNTEDETLTFPIKYQDDDIGYLIIADEKGRFIGSFSDAYKNLKFTKNE